MKSFFVKLIYKHDSFEFFLSTYIIYLKYQFILLKAPDTEDEKSGSDFQEFSKLLVNGQRVANDTNKSYIFMWRGYKACISSNLPKLLSHELNWRYKLATEAISKLPKEPESEPSKNPEVFRKPSPPNHSTSSTSVQSSSSSSRGSSQSILSDLEEPTQIPETQFDGNILIFNTIYLCSILFYSILF